MANRVPGRARPIPAGMSEVVIAGGGPVGLGLAIDLALRGVTSTVLERSESLHGIPKGQNLTQRTGEHLRAWGVSQAVRDASPIPPEFGNAGLVTHGSLLGRYHYDWFRRSRVGAYYFAENERLPQYILERILRDRASELPEITLVTGARVTGVEQDTSTVLVRYETTRNERRRVRAEFCAGCDGARSITREHAGIRSDTDREGPRMALLVFRSMELHDLLARFPGKSIFNVMNPDMEGYWQFLGRVDLNGGWFFHSPVPEGTTRENFDFHAFLHRVVGTEFALDFEHVGFWDLRISQARSYRSGRIFIAGDACHSHPPYGGYGINTGLEDARNLGWKLEAALNGWAGKGLLDSYSLERHPVFESVNADFISPMIDDFREFTASYSPARDLEAFEAAWAGRASADDSGVTQFLPHYAGSPIVAGAGGARPGARGVHEFTARPGHHLAPNHVPGEDLWNLLGTGFTLVDLSGNAELSRHFEQTARARGIPLGIVTLADPRFAGVYGCEAMLVRPDQFLAWVGAGGHVDVKTVLDIATGA